MATGRVNVGETSVKKTIVNESILVPYEFETEYDLINLDKNSINNFASINGDIGLKGEYATYNGECTWNIFLNGQNILSNNYPDSMNVDIKNFSIFKTSTDFTVEITLFRYYGSGNQGTIVLEFNFPLSSNYIKLTTKRVADRYKRKGKILKNYVLYSV